MLVFEVINDTRTSREFFIQNAIGWALREYSKTDRDLVTALVADTPLQPLSRREALNWIAEHPIRIDKTAHSPSSTPGVNR